MLDKPPPINPYAISSFRLGLLSLVFNFFTGLPAIVKGILALRDIYRNKERFSGKKLAFFGIFLGLFGIFLGLALFRFTFSWFQDYKDRSYCNLTQMAIAMHSYKYDHGKLPPPVVFDKNGNPLYSWRVLILPYLDQNELYNRFHLDEPWDSPHNISLLPLIPSVYSLPPGKKNTIPPYHTVCHLFVGKNAFEESYGLVIPDDFPDGPSNTFLIVEGGEPVPWTQPKNLSYSSGGKLPDLFSIFSNGFRVTFVDGSFEILDKNYNETIIHAFITRNGGEPNPREQLGKRPSSGLKKLEMAGGIVVQRN